MDIMYIEQSPVIHKVDEATRFSAARFLHNVYTMAIWDSILRCWATNYSGTPNRILVDQGSALIKSELFVSLATRSHVDVQSTGTEAHSSLGIGECYHQPLRNTFKNLRLVYPCVEREFLLSSSV